MGKFKLDGSSFTGREPNENRYDFDLPRFDSYSGRIALNPNAYWSFQVSEGFAKSPEETKLDEDVYRTTASVVYSTPLRKSNFVNVTALGGLNHSHADEQAALLEAVLVVKHLSVYGRYEYVQKSGEELDLDPNFYELKDLFPVNAITLGVGFDIIQSKATRVAIGAQGSYFSADSRLNSLYGQNPSSAEVFIRLYPPRMKMMKM